MIKYLSLSFLFNRTFLGNFDPSSQREQVLKDIYSNVFDNFSLNKKKNDKYDNYDFPWGKDDITYNNFWNFYFQRKEPSPAIFKKNIAALMYKINDCSIEHKKDKCIKINVKPYIYRHGIGLIFNICIINANVNKDYSRYEDDELKEIIKNLYTSCCYNLSFEKTDKQNTMNLKQLSDYLFDYIQEEVFKDDRLSPKSFDPFSVITISTTCDENDSEVIKEFSANIGANKGEILLKKSDRQIKMYYSNRSRVIWYPEGVNSGKKTKRTINCYHKNIVNLSLQIDSLTHFLRDYWSNSSEYYRENFRHHARNGQEQLVRLYGCEIQPEYSTYVSRSSIAQINDNCFNLINMIRKELSLSPIEKQELLVCNFDDESSVIGKFEGGELRIVLSKSEK